MPSHPKDRKPESHRILRYLKYALIAMIAILAVLAILFVGNSWSLARQGILNVREFWLSAFVRGHGPPTVEEIGLVRPWMTFDYVNRLFILPPDYLRTRLAIADPRYPHITISGYADHNRLDIGTVMNEVDGALRDYLINATSIAP
ncbi:MAG TPA: hypothetical protein VNG29_02340 [Candidatus Paceibacterota bacterium]|nr:hypothetical protein [Candidatus Paceibacterota bacterium]